MPNKKESTPRTKVATRPVPNVGGKVPPPINPRDLKSAATAKLNSINRGGK